MLRLFRSTRNVNGPTALCEKAPHPQLPSAFGETVSCSDKPGLGQESCAQLRVTSNTTAVRSLSLIPGTSHESDPHSSQIFHATSNTSGHSSDEDVDSNPGSSLHRATSDPNTPEGAESPHTPPIQCYTQPRDASDQDAATPLNASESTFPAVDLPVTQHDPNNSAHILKLLRRDTGGGATCLWQLDRGECGFSSQVDLVKRHIKRVHYRLR